MVPASTNNDDNEQTNNIDSNSIHINRFEVPEAVERGHSATLYCDYQLESHEELYAIKFYKNNIEFFRYVPKELTPKQSYKLLGIYVNVSHSFHLTIKKQFYSFRSSSLSFLFCMSILFFGFGVWT